MSQDSIQDPLSSIYSLIDSLANNQLPYPPRLTKYELARVVAARAKQLAMGARPLIDPRELNTYDPVAIAMEEVRRGLLSFIIVRPYPNGGRVRVRLRELLDLERRLNP